MFRTNVNSIQILVIVFMPVIMAETAANHTSFHISHLDTRSLNDGNSASSHIRPSSSYGLTPSASSSSSASKGQESISLFKPPQSPPRNREGVGNRYGPGSSVRQKPSFPSQYGSYIPESMPPQTYDWSGYPVYGSPKLKENLSQFINRYPIRKEDEPPTFPSGSLGYRPSLSPYHQNYVPSISYYPSPGWQVGKPSSSYDESYSSDSYHNPPSENYWNSHSSALASADGFGSAAAESSYPGIGWGQPEFPPPPKPFPSDAPETEDIYGWGPPAPPPRPPYKPVVPAFNQQFSLKPSSFGWETSYSMSNQY